MALLRSFRGCAARITGTHMRAALARRTLRVRIRPAYGQTASGWLDSSRALSDSPDWEASSAAVEP
ncbi:MAG: hypothetical protein OEV20_03530, partial [Actinomycetota bacterium]|nr:hypothetical protein [Actinomycetota bacterium]